MKKRFFILVLFIGSVFGTCFAGPNEFCEYSPSGHLLYYYKYICNDNNDNRVLVAGYNNYNYKPTGDVIIPDSVTHSQYGVSKTYQVVGIYPSGFDGCSGMTSVSIPNTVTEINGRAFRGCTGLTSITIPESVQFIRAYAFCGCTRLKILNYNAINCSSMGISTQPALENCDSLVTVNIGQNVMQIPDYFCEGRSSLSGNLVLPNSVRVIGYNAFRNCSGLTGSLIINDSIRDIPSRAFAGCSGLGDTLVIGKNVYGLYDDAFSGCTGFTTVLLNADSCEFMGVGNAPALNNCTNITTVHIAPNVKIIPYSAFATCTALTGYITFPPSVERIKRNAFFGCSQIQGLSFSRGEPPAIGETAFSYVNQAIPVNVPCGSVTMYQQSLPGFTNIISNGDGYDFNATSYDDNSGSVQILVTPNCIDVTAILQAIPTNGYHFDHWNDGETDNPYTLMVTSDTTLVAYFVPDGGTEGIQNSETNSLRLWVSDGRIMAEGIRNEQMQVFDIVGRLTPNENLPRGVYLVKVDDYPARKVVVIR